MEATVYTYIYEPFTMGGNVWKLGSAKVDCEALVEVGNGVSVYIFKSLNDTYHAAEKESGALVGIGLTFQECVDQVKEDIRTGDPEIMKKQMEKALEDSKNCNPYLAEDFLRRVGKGYKGKSNASKM